MEDLNIREVADEVKVDEPILGRLFLEMVTVASFKQNKKRLSLNDFPIVRIDRTTAQDLLPIFINKGIFTNYKSLRTDDEIITDEKKRLGKSEPLTFEEKRRALTKEAAYKSNGFVVRDYGNYAIGFSAELYIDYIKGTEGRLERELLTPTLFPEANKNIEEALRKIRLYKLAHKIAYVILAEIFRQKTLKGVVIKKKSVVEGLGYETDNKQIYQDIKDSIFTLRWLDYKLFDYSLTDTNRKRSPNKECSQSIGNFIYNIKEDAKQYTLHVNDIFVGCVAYLLSGERKSKNERKDLFGGRGFFAFPTRALPLTKDYSDPAYFLTQFLICERGNPRLNKTNFKIVSYRLERYVREAHIKHGRASRRFKDVISALREIEIVAKTVPPVNEIEKMKPSDGLKSNIQVWVKHPVTELDRHIQTIREGKR